MTVIGSDGDHALISAKPRVVAVTYGVRFWIGVLLGWAMIAFGIHSALRTYHDANPVYSVVTLVVFALVQDLIVAPAVIIIGLGLRRVVRSSPVTATAVGVALISVIVTAFSWPEIRRYGRDPALSSSLQTLNYATGLLIVLGVVWAVALVVVILRLVLRRRARA